MNNSQLSEKLKKMLDNGIPITVAKLLFGIIYSDEIKTRSAKEVNEIANTAGLSGTTAAIEIRNKGAKLAEYVAVKDKYKSK